MVEFERINVHYGKNHVLKDVSIRVGEGEVVSLIGSNAAGKTTTLRTALGLKGTTSGSLRFAGEDITRLATHERVHRGLVLVPEGRQAFVKFTVVENLLMGAYHRADRDRAQKEIDFVFDLFPRLRERRAQKAGSMSGGEQQMLAIARGLMAKPKCLLLDEPTLGLAPILVEEITATVRRLAASGMTVLLAEQNAAVALACAGRAYVLESGNISLEGKSEELKQTDAIKSLYLGH
ncbi:MAG TPA: ABC transporter ATP-binding protein [Burkholderiales bacterium]|nr:ABC transporter ATP-binding protein [Burkholderiales bacterium]